MNSLASPKIIAMSTASEATLRENLDSIESLSNQMSKMNEANTDIEAVFMIIKSNQD